ncbi:hypothetical protein C8J56DRAFT_734233, partial [Mycena floridula]
APTLGSDPISEITPGYMTQCFPTLFPDGSSDFHQPRLEKVDLGEYFGHLMRYKDGRFAHHHRFLWWAFNTLQQSRARSLGKVYVCQAHDAEGMMAEDLVQLL